MSIIKIPPYILDSTLDFTFNNVTATGNLVSLNANLGNAATANYFVGNGSMLTGLPTYASESFVSNAIANLVDAAPTTLNTLNELAAALGDDPNFATTITSALGNKFNTSDFTSNANTAINARVTKSFVDALGVVATTVTTNAQPNITSVGVLSGVTVNGKTTLGNISNITITGGSANYVLSTDGTGNLSWVAQTGGSGGGSTTLDGLTDVTITTPTNNQVLSYDDANSIWVNKTISGVSGGGVVFTNSTTAPSSPSEGDQWFDPTTGTTYTYISDGDSNQWVEFGTAAITSSAPSGTSTGKAFAMSLIFGG